MSDRPPVGTKQAQAETYICRVCEHSVVPRRHTDTGLSCPQCGVAVRYDDTPQYRSIEGRIVRTAQIDADRPGGSNHE